jgi:polyketide synthase PksN
LASQQVLRSAAPAATPAPSSVSVESVGRVVGDVISQLLKIPADQLDADAELSEFGFDSISLTALCNQLNRRFGLELMPTLFFEHSTPKRLARFLIDVHPDKLRDVDAAASEQQVQDIPRQQPASESHAQPTVEIAARSGREPVAIIGWSGRFPQAPDIDALWDALQSGKDCITEIPPARWNWREVFGDPRTEANKTNAKWGGFIDGVDEYDPLFFGISPQEAERMDPQQRLLMMYAWKAIEDAGYASQSLAGTKTAIFVGTSGSDYGQLISQSDLPLEGYSSRGFMASLGPSRMSYLLDVHGPSEPIETACSSSLVALHRAVRSIQTGESDMAIAGGIYIMLTPMAHIINSKAGALSPDGRCKTFSSGANGYVPGEGVGMLFLKRLSDAERDGDHIYGVVRGSAENHGGRATSLTAPNPRAQAELIKTVYAEADIDPSTVTYIEAHGTGTPLGDPIEINALKAAFGQLYADRELRIAPSRCGIGSIKTNIGHLELAAGVAGVIKVLLQMRHRTLVKSLHCDEINQYIQMDGSPFYIVREAREWAALDDARGRALPRRAGVSSFGFGGVNAHVCLEEYVSAQPQERSKQTPRKALIVLSAKQPEQLREQVALLHEALSRSPLMSADLESIAYTLQVGRDAMEERLGFVVDSVAALSAMLGSYLQSGTAGGKFYRGTVTKADASRRAADEARAPSIDDAHAWIERWVRGVTVEWEKFYDGSSVRPRRLSLPTYPFAKERCWVPVVERRARKAESRAVDRGFDRDALSSLLDQFEMEADDDAAASRQIKEMLGAL